MNYFNTKTFSLVAGQARRQGSLGTPHVNMAKAGISVQQSRFALLKVEGSDDESDEQQSKQNQKGGKGGQQSASAKRKKNKKKKDAESAEVREPAVVAPHVQTQSQSALS